MKNMLSRVSRVGSCVAVAALASLSSPAYAAVVITPAGSNFASAPYTFSFGDSTFTFSGTGDPFGPAAVSTGGTGQINTIFGSPTTNFTDRGTVTFGGDMQYAAFSAPTPVRFSNGNNFIGLQATSGSNTFFGFAYTTNSILNSFGFETTPGQAITATTAVPAVPEPATWIMMLFGVGFVGAMMRSAKRKQSTALSYA
jgi:hypothetical protein